MVARRDRRVPERPQRDVALGLRVEQVVAVVDRRLTMLAESMSDSPSFLTSFDTEALVVVASRLSKWT